MEKLSDIECRVLGTLLEKWLTTPQSYPLSLNALTNGCNQKSARDPESNYTDQEILEACAALKRRSLVTEFFGSSARVSKFEEALSVHSQLNKEQAAVLAELMLRGPQSEGELRQRASRTAPLNDLAALHAVIENLAARPEPLVKRLSDPTRSRGVRWTHTFGPEVAETEQPAKSPTESAPLTAPASGIEARLAALEARVAELEKLAGRPAD